MTVKEAGKAVKTTAIAAICASAAFVAATNAIESKGQTAPVAAQQQPIVDMAMSAGY